ncbi:MAG: glycosyltransferase family 4 protein [Candidatus Bathyarchaeia archaeon]
MEQRRNKPLRILVVISVYPPHYVGGYELGCQEVVERLKARGHRVLVLTSTFGIGKKKIESDVWRVLIAFINERFDNKAKYLWYLIRREIHNRFYFSKAVKEFAPDVIYIWAVLHLSSSVMFWAEKTGRRVVYFISDKWLASWRNEIWYRLWNGDGQSIQRYFKKSVAKALDMIGLVNTSVPSFRDVGFCSEYIEQTTIESGVAVERPSVIHWGVDLSKYKSNNYGNRKILYAGQCMPHKGIETAIRSIYLLKTKFCINEVSMTVVGGSLDSQYYEKIIWLSKELGLQNSISFLGMVSREEVREMMQQHGIFLFPVIWDEPFSIALLEAMASGMVVVGTSTGGTKEILKHNINALIFERGNDEECARCIKLLIEDNALYERIRKKSLEDVKAFHIEKMVDKIEEQLYGEV